MTYVVFLLLISTSLLPLGCYGCEEGDIRLVGGSDNSSGRVEFCHGGEWGTVCHDDWGVEDARVVCRQLGLPTNVTLALYSFGGGSGAILLDNVECSGLEERLEDCNHNGVGAHNCDHEKDAGATCSTLAEQDGGKQCNSENSGSELTRGEVERFGNCVPYEAREQSNPCDTIYTPEVDQVYISHQRTGGNIDTYRNIIDNAAGLVAAAFRGKCFDPAVRILCHYYLPPCGNATTLEYPTSVCMETCNYLRELCPNEWNNVLLYFEENDSTVRSYGVTFINCSNTGEHLNPLPYCCSDVGIDMLRPHPSTTVSSDSSQQKSENLAIIIGPVCASAAILLLAVIGAVLWIVIKKRRQAEKKKQLTQDPRSPASLDSRLDLHGQEVSPRYHGNENLLQPSLLVPPKMAQVNSGFIRQMSDRKLLIPERNIHMQDCVGQGEFGIVYRATLSGWRGKGQELVAVKMLRGVFSASELESIVEEILKMSTFNHPNVMRLVGVCIDGGESPYIVMPFMTHGSLLSYLRKHRAELTIASDDNEELITTAQKKLLSMCLQISKGMSYLANEKFVHRDLAARNCMIDNKFVIKVSDFGLTEDIYARNYFRQTKLGEEGGDQVKLPVRWMALESLNDGVFSEKTDVWSFGVTCWEVFSVGKTPYPGMDPFALIKYLERGERLEKPPNTACSQEIYDIMKECWKEVPEKRPTFSDLVTTISTSLEAIAGYLDFTATPLTPAGNFKNEPDHLTVTAIDEEGGSQNLFNNPN